MRKESSTNHKNKNLLKDVCPLMFSLTKIGNRWKPYVLWKLMDGNMRFAELKREIPNITERMLILSLKELAEDGLIDRMDYKQVPPKVEYSLTPSAKRLKSIFDELYHWGKLEMKKSKALPVRM